jgi:hypothetical protein
MAKKLSTFRLEESSRALLKKIAEKEKRSEANMIEVMIDEKAALYEITLDEPEPDKRSSKK